MSYKWYLNCLKSSLIACFLLILQPTYGQENFTELDSEIEARKKLLGDDFVLMLWIKDDTLVY